MSFLSVFHRFRAAPVASLGVLMLLGCGSLADGSAPSPSDEIKLDINGPRETDHVRGPLLVTVKVTGAATPDKVQLFRGNALLATLIPPFQYTWDTADEKEGVYPLKARAEWNGWTFESPLHTVVVDRTPPVVKAVWPVGHNVHVTESVAIRVTFSEPMLPSSVRMDQLMNRSYPVSAKLSEDGMSLGVPQSRSSAPNQDDASLNLEGLTDLAGNPLLEPGGPKTHSWTWKLPLFWTSAASGSEAVTDGVALALEANGNPVVAYSAKGYAESPPLPGEHLFVKRWTSEGWTRVGGLLSVGPVQASTKLRNPLLVLGSDGNPVVAFLQGREGEPGRMLQVFRWDSATWQPLGSTLNGAQQREVHGAALVMDSEGRPIVAWSDVEGLHVARWEVNQWVALGGLQRGTPGAGVVSAQPPSLAVDGAGRVVLSWAEAGSAEGAPELYLRRWTGTLWEPLGKTLKGDTGRGIREHALLLLPNGGPMVAWSEGPEPFGSWESSVYEGSLSETGWTMAAVWRSAARAEARGPALALDAEGRALVAWNDGGEGSGIYLNWFPSGSSSWSDLAVIGSGSARLSMAVSPLMGPLIAWTDGAGARVAWLNK
ncbi:Ig-like domain-containing protein [Pyxidicoccus xibeiensis]|uniref:Ig-like domain-containing protein n=1 Tax=Pyxidicoccus xibeiensis TaxID=2906759 RepID=UPI0020A81E2B|nr:Ig-like domain-containing protein [Pyxidicoccus xibeiensis]MCP3137463.1 hypothetical protein [Pyxidicoccus xibeiensis]